MEPKSHVNIPVGYQVIKDEDPALDIESHSQRPFRKAMTQIALQRWWALALLLLVNAVPYIQGQQSPSWAQYIISPKSLTVLPTAILEDRTVGDVTNPSALLAAGGDVTTLKRAAPAAPLHGQRAPQQTRQAFILITQITARRERILQAMLSMETRRLSGTTTQPVSILIS